MGEQNSIGAALCIYSIFSYVIPILASNDMPNGVQFPQNFIPERYHTQMR